MLSLVRSLGPLPGCFFFFFGSSGCPIPGCVMLTMSKTRTSQCGGKGYCACFRCKKMDLNAGAVVGLESQQLQNGLCACFLCKLTNAIKREQAIE